MDGDWNEEIEMTGDAHGESRMSTVSFVFALSYLRVQRLRFSLSHHLPVTGE